MKQFNQQNLPGECNFFPVNRVVGPPRKEYQDAVSWRGSMWVDLSGKECDLAGIQMFCYTGHTEVALGDRTLVCSSLPLTLKGSEKLRAITRVAS